ncbi:hypothetical protein [Kitasatospora sp. NPDC058218]|uniref:hypothetical protein n=1 Tax=Kitasatospora sp. NPDC058218 TaxID=3346385 RepID=UPI0036D90DE8
MADAYTRRRNWGQAVTVWTGRASVQPYRSTNPAEPERETTTETLTVFLPVGAVVDSADRIVLQGQVYDVQGEPAVWQAGALSHIRLTAWRARR